MFKPTNIRLYVGVYPGPIDQCFIFTSFYTLCLILSGALDVYGITQIRSQEPTWWQPKM